MNASFSNHINVRTGAATLTSLFLLAHALTGLADDSKPANSPDVSVTPRLTYVHVDGDADKFREDWWMSDGWTGGIEEFTLDQALKGDWKLRLDGRAIVDEEDYRLQLEIVKPEFMFFRAGYTEYRKYYDDTGGFYSQFAKPSYDLDNDLVLDIGSIYFEAGLIKPDLPKLTLGYERQFKDGAKSLLEWGAVSDGVNTRNIFPSYKEIDETTDIFKLVIAHDIKTVHIGDDFRYERYKTDTTRFDATKDLLAPLTKRITIRETYDHDALFNTFHMSSHLNEKMYWSFGYLFNDVDGDGGINVVTIPTLVGTDRNWDTRTLMLETQSHVVNLNLMIGPFAGCNFYTGVQAEGTDSDGYTVADLTNGLNPTTVSEIQTANERENLQEVVGIRYTKIPWTTLYAEGKWEQGTYDIVEWEREDGIREFRRETDSDVSRQNYTVGFNTAPIRKMTLSGRYRHRINENDYDHDIDTELGYPAFITAQDFTSDEVMAKLTVRPWSRLSLSLSYQLVATDIDTTTQDAAIFLPGGTVQAGNHDAHIYSLGITVIPVSRLYVTGLFSYQDVRTVAFDNDVAAVQTYEGDVYTLIATVGYAIDKKTDITAQYVYSFSDNFEDNSADGLPLGLDNHRHGLLVSLVRKITEKITGQLQYGYYKYDDQVAGTVDDYNAHLAAASCSIRF
jgi:hypothetical protein